jgi:hypothetical protein
LSNEGVASCGTGEKQRFSKFTSCCGWLGHGDLARPERKPLQVKGLIVSASQNLELVLAGRAHAARVPEPIAIGEDNAALHQPVIHERLVAPFGKELLQTHQLHVREPEKLFVAWSSCEA